MSNIIIGMLGMYGVFVTWLLFMSYRKITGLRCDTSMLAGFLYKSSGITINEGLSETPNHFTVDFENATLKPR